MHSHIPQKYRATITIFITFDVKFKYYFLVITHQGSVNTACKMLHIVGATLSFALQEYLQIKLASVSIRLTYS